MIQTSKVRKAFNDSGVQISPQAMDMIKSDFSRHIIKMVARCKNGNVKRLTENTYHISSGNLDTYLK